MAKHVYRVMLSDEKTDGRVEWHEVTALRPHGGWSAVSAIEWCRKQDRATRIERTTNLAALRHGCPFAAKWLLHRSYVVDTDGAVRRTDRTSQQRPACRSCGSFPAITARRDGLCQDCGKAHDGGEPTASAYRG